MKIQRYFVVRFEDLDFEKQDDIIQSVIEGAKADAEEEELPSYTDEEIRGLCEKSWVEWEIGGIL